MINYISDWRARLRARLYLQFKDKPRFQQFADLIAAQAQDLEDAFQSLFTIASIDDSEGAQLEVLGRRVGQTNLGWEDASYQLFLKARVLINKSYGSIEQLYAILRQAIGDIGYKITYGGTGTKQFLVQVDAPITSIQAAAALLFVTDSKDAGARGVLQWGEFPPSEGFRFDVGPGFDVGKLSDAADRQR